MFERPGSIITVIDSGILKRDITFELLIRLDPTQAKARFESQLNQLLALQAEEARLLAERDGAERIVFPPTLLHLRNHPRVAESVTSQKRIFESRRRSFKGRIAIFKQRIEQLRSAG